MSEFREIFEKIPDAVTLHDPADGSIIEANERFCEMLGYSREELLEIDLQDIFVNEPPYTWERAQEHIRAAATDGPQTFEWVDVTKDGDRLPVEVNLSRTRINGNDRMLAVVREIAERKRRERALRVERDRANALFAQLGEPIVEVEFQDGVPTVLAVNDAFEGTFGIAETELVGEHLDEHIVPDGARDLAASLNEETLRGEIGEAEIERETPDGLRTFLLRTVPYSLEGTPRAYAIYFDITDRIQQKERFQAFIQQSTDVISVVGPDGTWQYLSPSAERIFGYDRAELVGEVAFDYVHPDDRERAMSIFADAVADPEMVATVEFRFRHRDGSWIWLESVGNNQLSNPAIEGFVVNSREITARKEKEQLLERQNERLEAFASVVSHDLRNPLNVAEGRLELVREECDSPNLEPVEWAHDRMRTLIEDLLTLARQGEHVGAVEPVDLAELGERCWGNVETGEAQLQVETGILIEADPDRLQQLLENLHRNAIEHGGEDVTVRIGRVENGFYVEDDGVGIPEDERADVFDAGYTTVERGTGLGLSIVNEIVDAHEWEIRATESPSGGARFEIAGVTFVD